MAYFHLQYPVSTKNKQYFSVLGETHEEMTSVARRYPEATLINLPPRGRESFRSKSLPHLLVDVSRRDILEEIGSVEVSQDYFRVLNMLLREQCYNDRVGPNDESRKFFQLEVRGKLIMLLRSGAWVDDPESLTLKNLNNRLEKLDLGRRSDLKFSSRQSEDQKYDQDLRRDKKEAEEKIEISGPHWSTMDTDELIDFLKHRATETDATDIWNSKPWLHARFREAGLSQP